MRIRSKALSFSETIYAVHLWCENCTYVGGVSVKVFGRPEMVLTRSWRSGNRFMLTGLRHGHSMP
jgi:hypothetical protein